jgi:hypothetical protein
MGAEQNSQYSGFTVVRLKGESIQSADCRYEGCACASGPLRKSSKVIEEVKAGHLV